jgi:nucleoside phosphorylase/tetratricopeptide (TPR) repeat protein
MNPTADVLIVTVTKVESRAVLNAFEEATGRPAETTTIDERVYRNLGEVNGVRVFLALSQMGTSGLDGAQQAVQKGIEALKPGAVVMVGIAFGMNEEKQTIGDILVSRQLMLYEAQRVGMGEIVPRGDRPHASTRLVNYLQSAEVDWDGAEVRIGLVLTGEKLVDNLDYREQLKTLEREAIGGEMEGAGLYVACQNAKVDWILVKAICDWADGNKAHDKDTRQRQAAQNAAAFVLHALQHAPLKRLVSSDSATAAHIPTTQAAPPVDTPTRSTLPHQPYFFGRKQELQTIAEAVAPEARTWGALIDGPGGIGKTALAVYAGHQAPADHFPLKLFLSAKVRELTPAGEQPLQDFMLPGFQELLKELARELGEEGIERVDPNERAKIIRTALAGRRALLVIDNLETFPEPERVRLYQFLCLLPICCKAIVTSRRRADIDARAIRLDRLALNEALDFMTELARNSPSLARVDETGRRQLYEHTNGNPLLIRWLVGQFGRAGSRCRNVDEACTFLDAAPPGNDPLEYVFGDLLDSFTENETAVLGALVHFDRPAKLEWLAELAGLARLVAQTALEDLADRALLVADAEAETFFLPPYAGTYLRRKHPEAVAWTGERLMQRVYALTVENGYENHDRFSILETEWPTISAALPLLFQSENNYLQTVYRALWKFLNFSGRWDECLELGRQTEAKALVAQDFLNAGWLAYEIGWLHSLRGEADEVLNHAKRCEAHWRQAKVGTYEQTIAMTLTGLGFQWKQDYSAALAIFSQVLDLFRAIAPESESISTALGHLAVCERLQGDLIAAERDFHEALRIAKKHKCHEGIAVCTGNLAEVALDRENWVGAELLAQEALELAEQIGRQELIGSSCWCLALALGRQGRCKEGLSYAHRAVDIFTRLRQPDDLEKAQAALQACGGEDFGSTGHLSG